MVYEGWLGVLDSVCRPTAETGEAYLKAGVSSDGGFSASMPGATIWQQQQGGECFGAQRNVALVTHTPSLPPLRWVYNRWCRTPFLNLGDLANPGCVLERFVDGATLPIMVAGSYEPGPCVTDNTRASQRVTAPSSAFKCACVFTGRSAALAV